MIDLIGCAYSKPDTALTSSHGRSGDGRISLQFAKRISNTALRHQSTLAVPQAQHRKPPAERPKTQTVTLACTCKFIRDIIFCRTLQEHDRTHFDHIAERQTLLQQALLQVFVPHRLGLPQHNPVCFHLFAWENFV